MTSSRPRAPAGKRLYAIGDVHGCRGQLDALLGQILEDAARDRDREKVLITLGDYVDRGPASREVLEILSGFPLPGFTCVHLRGNHDTMMRAFLEDPAAGPLWLMNGGDATCRSYMLDPAGPPIALSAALGRALPRRHRAFLDSLALSHVEGDYLFVHAGLRPGVPLAEQDPEDLIWIRDPFLFSTRDHGWVVVHGRSPTDAPDRRPNRIGIDTGACYGGRLTCLVLEEDSQRFLQA
ncbi:MAG: serine/threonine protein phosphatase [Kiloniellales bacterium]|nr:serine/threonine protein phosphatase [Kiloniellales bacterium]